MSVKLAKLTDRYLEDGAAVLQARTEQASVLCSPRTLPSQIVSYSPSRTAVEEQQQVQPATCGLGLAKRLVELLIAKVTITNQKNQSQVSLLALRNAHCAESNSLDGSPTFCVLKFRTY